MNTEAAAPTADPGASRPGDRAAPSCAPAAGDLQLLAQTRASRSDAVLAQISQRLPMKAR